MRDATDDFERRACPDRSVWLLVVAIAYPLLNVLALRSTMGMGLSDERLALFAYIAPGLTIAMANLVQQWFDGFNGRATLAFCVWIAFLGYVNYQLFWAAVASV